MTVKRSVKIALGVAVFSVSLALFQNFSPSRIASFDNYILKQDQNYRTAVLSIGSVVARRTFDIEGRSNANQRFVNCNLGSSERTSQFCQDEIEKAVQETGKSSDQVEFPLIIETQRSVLELTQYAVASGDLAPALLALASIEWAFSPEIVGGDLSSDVAFTLWPAERRVSATPALVLKKEIEVVHPKSEYLYAAARSLSLLKNSPFYTSNADVSARVKSLALKVSKAASFFSKAPATLGFLDKGKQMNQLLFVVTAIRAAGFILNNSTLLNEADLLLDKAVVFENRTTNSGEIVAKGFNGNSRDTQYGVLYESGGFDSSYQAVSLELLSYYYITTSDSAKKSRLKEMIIAATDKLVSKIDPLTGRIRSAIVYDLGGGQCQIKNSRTQEYGSRNTASLPYTKGNDIDSTPMRLRFIAKLFSDDVSLAGKLKLYADSADLVDLYGQGFDHFVKATVDCKVP